MSRTHKITNPDKWHEYIPLFEIHKRGRAILFQALRLGIGELIVDSPELPKTATLNLIPIHFVTGDPYTKTAIKFLETVSPVQFVFIPDNRWVKQIQQIWGNKTISHKRTRLFAHSLDLQYLRTLKAKLPQGFVIRDIKNEHLDQIPKGYLEAIEMVFNNRECFLQSKYGVAIEYEKRLASIAYPAFPYIDAFEIQVLTIDEPEFRRRGLATVACSALMIEALEDNVIPHWDAANESSVELAKKLGYVDPDPYYAYFKKPD